MTDTILSGMSTMAVLLVAMVVIALVEAAAPLHARERRHRAHVAPNLALTGITFATNLVLNSALVLLLEWLEVRDVGLLPGSAIGGAVEIVLVVVMLDFSFYLAHVAMHRVPLFWRFHRVHHSDPVLDVTTTVRQHPGEGLIRYAFVSAFAVSLGASPVAFGVYRTLSALTGLLEHANVRVPRRLDTVLALVTSWPTLHKVHHSRIAAETDTNYGNLFSFFDRAFRTFTPPERGATVVFGLDGLDDPTTQSTAGLLALPFRGGGRTPTTGNSTREPPTRRTVGPWSPPCDLPR